MQLIPVQVECYAGHKADETPRRLCWAGEWVEICEVLDRWYQVESRPEWPRADYFKVRDRGGNVYLLKHDLEVDGWFVGRHWPAPVLNGGDYGTEEPPKDLGAGDGNRTHV